MKSTLAALSLFLVIALFFHFAYPGLPDLDSFFYLGLSRYLAETSLFNVSAPHLPYSAIGDYSYSPWWGFTLFLLPFSLLTDPILGIKLAGVFLTFCLLAATYFVARRHQFRWTLLLPLFFLVSAPNVMFRFFMTRPQTLSWALSLLLFSLLLQGPLWAVAAVSFALTFFHLNLLWLPVLIAAAVEFWRFVFERRLNLHALFAVAGGVLLGLISRPEVLGAFRLLAIQLVEQAIVKQQGVPLLFGVENLPLSLNVLFSNFLVFLLVWSAALLLFLYFFFTTPKNEVLRRDLFFWSSASLSLLFFILAVTSARRAYDFWVAFGLLTVWFVFSRLPDAWPHSSRASLKSALSGILIVSLSFLILFSGYKTNRSLQTESYPPDDLKTVGAWLKTNAPPGAVIANLRWSDFSSLFLWYRDGAFLGGLDPIFQYSHAPELYWQTHYLTINRGLDVTCPAVACRTEDLIDTYDSLAKNFRADFIVLDKRFNSPVKTYLDSDSRYETALETEREVVYRILRDL